MIQPLPSSPVSSPAILLPVAYTLVILDHLHKSKVNLLATSTDFADSFLSLKGVSLPLAYLSFKNQIIYYLLSKTTPPPQTMIYVLHLCLYSKRGTKLSCQPIPLCCHLIQCNKRLLSVYYVLHIPDEKKQKKQNPHLQGIHSLPRDTQGNIYFRLQMIQLTWKTWKVV